MVNQMQRKHRQVNIRYLLVSTTCTRQTVFISFIEAADDLQQRRATFYSEASVGSKRTVYLFRICVNMVGLFIYRVMSHEDQFRWTLKATWSIYCVFGVYNENVLDDTFIAAADAVRLDCFEATTFVREKGSELSTVRLLRNIVEKLH